MAYPQPIYNNGVLVGYDYGSYSLPVSQVNFTNQPYASSNLNGTANIPTTAASGGDVLGVNTQAGGGGGGGEGGVPSGDGGGEKSLQQILEEARARERQIAENAFNIARAQANRNVERARGLRDELTGMIGKKRDQFGQLRDEGEQTAINSFEDVKRQLATNTKESELNQLSAARAQGIKGSGIMNLLGRVDRNFNRGSGENQRVLQANERENQRTYDDRLAWADAQEADANRSYQAAVDAANDLVANGVLGYQRSEADTANQYASTLANILAQAQQIKAMGGNVNNYVADPFTADMSGAVSSLNMPTYSNANTGTANQAVNVVSPDGVQELLKRLYQTA